MSTSLSMSVPSSMSAPPGFVTWRATPLRLESRTPAGYRRSESSCDVAPAKFRVVVACNNQEVLREVEGESRGTQLRKRAMRLEALGDRIQAKKMYQHCVIVEPGLGKAWRDLAKMELRSGLGSAKLRAVAVLKQGIAANPTNPFLLTTLGNTEFRRGRIKEARQAFNDSLRLDRSARNIYAFHALARFEALQGNLQVARETFVTAIKLLGVGDADKDSDDSKKQDVASIRARLYHTWGIAEQKAQHIDIATDLYHRGLREQPNNSFILVTVGQLYATAGKVDDARGCFKQAVEAIKSASEGTEVGERNPDPGGKAFVLECWGRLESQLGRWDAARKIFREAYESAPWDGAVIVGLSSVEMSLGNVEEARNLAALGIQKHPNSSLVWRHFAMIEAMQGNADECRACFFHALQENPNDWLVYEDWFDAEIHFKTAPELARKFLDESFAMRLHAQGEASALCCSLDDRHRINAHATAQRRQLRGVKRFVGIKEETSD